MYEYLIFVSSVDLKLTVLDEHLFRGGSEKVDGDAQVLRGLEQVAVDLAGQDVPSTESHGRSAALGHLSEHHAEVGDGILHGALKLLKVASSVLATCKKHKFKRKISNMLDSGNLKECTCECDE